MGCETETVEYKESLAEREEGGQSLVGFANKRGGTLYFGVKNNGDIVGMTVSEKTVRQLSHYFMDNIEPKLFPTFDIEEHKGRQVIKIHVEKSDTPYHCFKKEPFIRVSSETRQMPQEEYKRRLITYQELNQDFSARIMREAVMGDLSQEAISNLRKLLEKSERVTVDITKLSDIQLLRDLQLLRDDKLTLAALVLLGKEDSLSRLLPYVEMRYSYKLNESEARTQDIQIFKGGYLLYYDKVWEKINSRNLSLTVPQGLIVREVKAFDEDSIREAVNNMVVHRDYSLQESVFISQLQTKLQVKSPGGFVDGVTVDNILDESKTRNKLIADTLFKAGFVEHLGSGVNLMFKNQLAHGKSAPDYLKSANNSVVLDLDGKVSDVDFAKYVFNVADKNGRELSDKELIILNQIKDGKRLGHSALTDNLLQLGLIEKIGYGRYLLSRNYYESSKRTGEYTRTRGLSKEANKMLILEHLKTNKGYKKDLEQVLPGVAWHTIYRYLQDLRIEGKIEFSGSQRITIGERAGYWKLKSYI